MLVFLTAIIAIVYILISRPLRQLSDSFATGDAGRIEPLLRRKDEIGEAAKLMQQVQEQQKSLQVLNQAAEEARHRADLRSREAERMNDLMVGRELKMIALKKQLRDARSPKRRSTKKEGPS
jgi:methyl-accepting chemotaxis protein